MFPEDLPFGSSNLFSTHCKHVHCGTSRFYWVTSGLWRVLVNNNHWYSSYITDPLCFVGKRGIYKQLIDNTRSIKWFRNRDTLIFGFPLFESYRFTERVSVFILHLNPIRLNEILGSIFCYTKSGSTFISFVFLKSKIFDHLTLLLITF